MSYYNLLQCGKHFHNICVCIYISVLLLYVYKNIFTFMLTIVTVEVLEESLLHEFLRVLMWMELDFI